MELSSTVPIHISANKHMVLQQKCVMASPNVGAIANPSPHFCFFIINNTIKNIKPC